MEEGKIDLAGKEKHRLEEKQRKHRKEREELGILYQPLWFQESTENTLTKE